MGTFTRRMRRSLPAVAFGLAACVSVAAGGAAPARWSSPSAACLAEAEAFAAAVTGRRVSLSDTAFGQGAELVLEPVMPRDAHGRPLDGRRRDVTSETFRLALRAQACVMTHPASGRSASLPACRCTPL